jgi:hypothetical protein
VERPTLRADFPQVDQRREAQPQAETRVVGKPPAAWDLGALPIPVGHLPEVATRLEEVGPEETRQVTTCVQAKGAPLLMVRIHSRRVGLR